MPDAAAACSLSAALGRRGGKPGGCPRLADNEQAPRKCASFADRGWSNARVETKRNVPSRKLS
jgi:hypothetical protein